MRPKDHRQRGMVRRQGHVHAMRDQQATQGHDARQADRHGVDTEKRGSRVMEQLDLFTRPARESSYALARRVIETLQARDWTTASALCGLLGLPAGEGCKRALRAAAEASDGQIISGQLGYKLTAAATPAEAHHAAAWLDAQAVAMSGRARAIRRAWHAAGARGEAA